MKKLTRLFSLLIIFVLFLSFTGCTGNDDAKYKSVDRRAEDHLRGVFYLRQPRRRLLPQRHLHPRRAAEGFDRQRRGDLRGRDGADR